MPDLSETINSAAINSATTNNTPSKLRRVSAFLLSVLICFFFASVFHSAFVLNGLLQLDINISWADRFGMIINDLIGLLPGYGSIILVGLLLGYLIIGLLRRFVTIPTVLAYAIGGLLSLLAIHMLMYPLMHITLIAGARSEAGLIFQLIAGAIGGAVFGYLIRTKPETSAPSH